MFDGSFWDDVLGTARENLGSLFSSKEQAPQQPWGWIQPAQQNSAWGWMGSGSPKTAIAARNPFTQALQNQRAAKSGAATSGAFYGGQFSYETPLQLSQDPQTQQYVQWAREAARATGVDEEVFLRQINQESRFNPNAVSAAGAKGLGQLMDPTAKELGVTNPYDPQQNLGASARYLKQQLDHYSGDYTKALAAYNAGAGNVDTWGGVPQGESAVYVNNIMAGAKRQQAQAAAQAQPNNPEAQAAARPLHGLTTAQYGAEGLATGAADYICGPIAAQAFVKSHGRNPTLAEALGTARQLGLIDPTNGMHGIESTAQLIKALGGVATVDYHANVQTMGNELLAGRPVIVNTPTHYFVAEDYDPRTGKFDFGNSARALGTVNRDHGGNTWYTLDEISHLMIGNTPVGAVRGVIYAH